MENVGREHGKVVRGWLGIYVQRVTPAIAESMGLEEPRGALVAEVLSEGPAKGAGVKRGDVIAAYNGTPIEDSRELPLMVARTPLGQTQPGIPITVAAGATGYVVLDPATVNSSGLWSMWILPPIASPIPGQRRINRRTPSPCATPRIAATCSVPT